MEIDKVEIDIKNKRYVVTIGEHMFSSSDFNIMGFINDSEVRKISNVKLTGYHSDSKLFKEVIKLLNSKAVETLDLSDNYLGRDALGLATILGSYPVLKKLDVSGNNLRDHTVDLIKTLLSIGTLDSLDISENGILAPHAEIISLVDSHGSLIHVDISGNDDLADLAGHSKFIYAE